MLTKNRNYLITCLLAVATNFAISQNLITQQPKQIRCAADEMRASAFRNHPELKVKQELIDRNYMEAVERLKQNNQTHVGQRVVYTIPVVVHVMHLPGTPVGLDENISSDLVRAGIQHMTEAFRKQAGIPEYNGTSHNSGTNPAVSGVDVEIQFELAKRDTLDNATDGIERIATNLSYLDIDSLDQDSALKNLSRWNPSKYLNIWLVKEVCRFATSDCSPTGYAFLASAHGTVVDGIVSEASFFGSSRHNSKVVIHDAGHYLNLYHTYEGGCPNNNCLTNGDLVCDTPPDNSSNTVNCGAATNTCTTDADDTDVRNPYRPVVNGGIGDQDDNYENYMDFGFQVCQTTFTAGQKDRMVNALTTMRNSLITNNNALVSPTSAPLVFFSEDGGYINESAGDTAIDCRAYIDVQIPIQLLNAPLSNDTILVSVDTSSTASNIADFMLRTDTVFIATGSLTGNVVLRLYNDKAVEDTERVVLKLVSAVLGVASYNMTYSLAIIDDDAAPTGFPTVIYETNFNTGVGWISGALGGFTTNLFTISSNGGTCTNGNSLYVTNNTLTNENEFDDIVSSPLAYRLINATRYTKLTVSFDYKVGGISGGDFGNVVYRKPDGTGNFSLLTGYTNLNNVICQRAVINLDSTFDNKTFDFGFNFDTQGGNTAAAPTLTIDSFEVRAAATPIASTIALFSTEYLGPNSTVYFKAPTGELLASIQNLTNHDYGCTSIYIQRVGTGAKTNGGTYKYSDKTIFITPTNNNASGLYNITLYYTQAERDGWLAATGNSPSQIKVLKAVGLIPDATDATTSSAPTTAGTYGTGYSFTAQFSAALAGFSIGTNEAVLDVSLLDFTGKREQNNVALAWSTASETDNDYFEVGKSTDAKNFVYFTKVKSKGNGNQTQSYNALDEHPSVGVNYYRLKIVDLLGKETFSKTIAVDFDAKAGVKVYPNPTKAATVTVDLMTEKEGDFRIEWYDALGRLIQTNKQSAFIGQNIWDVNIANLESGVYLIRIQGVHQTQTEAKTIRFVKL